MPDSAPSVRSFDPPPMPALLPEQIFQRLDQTSKRPYSREEYIRRFAWNLVGRPLFHGSPARAFSFRRWLLRRFGATLGHHTFLYSSVKIFHPWLLKMGDHVTLARGVELYNLGPIHIGSHTVVSQDAYLCAGTHDYSMPNLPLVRPWIRVGSGVWIAAQAFIGPYVTVWDNSVVAARAVVVKDVPAGTVVGGNPSRVLKPRPMNSNPLEPIP